MKILIADDDTQILRGIQFLLAKRGHDIYVAEDGEMALQLVRAEQPDLIFLDMNMPRKSGLEVCEAIRADASLRERPIYILTGQDPSLPIVNHDIASGVTAYLIKPFAPRELLDILELHETSHQ